MVGAKESVNKVGISRTSRVVLVNTKVPDGTMGTNGMKGDTQARGPWAGA